MISGYEGFEAKKSVGYGNRESLPAGGYVCVIKGVRLEGEEGVNQRIQLAIDVDEGDYKGFFQKDFDANTDPEKKWHGTATVWVPVNDGTEKAEWNRTRFENFVWAVIDSNPGFNWDWDETKLKGKKIGVIYKELVSEKGTVYTVSHNAYYSTADIKAGKFRVPKQAEAKAKTKKASFEDVTNLPDIESALPF